jgi:deaminated glutathione amidase
MRPVIAAALQLAPAASVDESLRRAVALVERCVAETGAELLVLPEAMTTGFTPGPQPLRDTVSEIPGPVSEPIGDVASRLGVHVVFGTYERGEDAVFNSAVLVDPSGDVAGVYRKTHLFRSERAWCVAGEEPTVVDTDLGRIGLMICFDGDFPELARIEAVRGAAIIARPSALLRSADIWELTNRARAYDNHVFVIGANAIGTDPGGMHYFGNSMIVGPNAHVLCRATSQEGWAAATLDPDAFGAISPGGSIPQSFDHLEDRNVGLYARHRAELETPARNVLA